MKTATINFVQRTATGTDDSGRTTIWCAPTREPFGVGSGAVDWGVGNPPKDALAVITIVHPQIMAGASDEIAREFLRAARTHARENGWITVSRWGIEFWQE